jgi:hypothetical protein
MTILFFKVYAATPSLPFSENFNNSDLKDTALTTAEWSDYERALIIAWKKSQKIKSSLAINPTVSNITSDANLTFSIALGDLDGDGDLDLVATGMANRLYLNNGSANPFNGIDGSNIGSDLDDTQSVVLGDVDGDGDLDLIVGNYSAPNRLYLNNGTSAPFNGISGIAISPDVLATRCVVLGDIDNDGDLDLLVGNGANHSNRYYLNDGLGNFSDGINIGIGAYSTHFIALGDMDGDGDLDLVAGNYHQPNRLYLNNGTVNPFDGVAGSDIDSDAKNTRSLVLGDVDNDGDLDIVTGNFNQINRIYFNNGTTTPFSAAAGNDIGLDANNTYAVTLGDVDNDGDLDIVAGNLYQANRLYVNSGKADPFKDAIGIDIGLETDGTTSVALGDIDRDGDLDLVAGNANYQINKLYLNNGVNHPFYGAEGNDVSSDANDTTAIALGDVDNDGDLDLVAGNYDAVNKLYLNNGTDDPFGGVIGSDIGSDAHLTYAVALGDLDNDGDLDLVVGNNLQTNRAYANNGTSDPFGGVTGIDIGADTYATTSIALGDVNNDGYLDIVEGNYNQTNRLYFNNQINANLSFSSGGAAYIDISSDTDSTFDIALGDIDNDGDLDLVAGNAGQANRFYLNNGTSNPFDGVSGSDVGTDTDNTFAIALGDVDNDGDLDLVAGNHGTNRLYLNGGASSNLFYGVSGNDIGFGADTTVSIALEDIDKDGDLDCIAGNTNQINRLYLNNGTADLFNGVSGIGIGSRSKATYAIALGDMDNDGDMDLVTGNHGQTNMLYFNKSTWSSFNGIAGYDIGHYADYQSNSTQSIVLGDIDNDGDLDLIAGNANQVNLLYLNEGADSFSDGIAIAADIHDTRSVALGDVDRDGDLDLVVGNYNQPNRLYLNNGTANPFGLVDGSDIGSDVNTTTDVILEDLDNDGDLDLITLNEHKPGQLFFNDGTGSFSVGTALSSYDSSSTSLAFGDVDNDGDIDLVTGNYHATNRLYLNDGTGTFAASTAISSDIDETSSVVLGDIDNDGDLDLVVGNYAQANKLYLNDGTGTFAAGVDIAPHTHVTYCVVLADADNDGDLDLAVGNAGAVNRFYLNDGAGNFMAGIDISADAHTTSSMVFGDINNDGDLDLVVGNIGYANRLYQRRHYRTHLDTGTSLRVDTESSNIDAVMLTSTRTLSLNTGVDYFVSNNAGARYYQVYPGKGFVFPSAGNNLRWKAVLHSFSPILSPNVKSVNLRLYSHGRVEFGKSHYSGDENGTYITVTVSRVGGSDGAVSVDINSSDISGGMDTGNNHLAVARTLNWSDGEDEDKNISIQVFDDNVIEGDENFMLSLLNPTGGAVLGISTATVTVLEDDVDTDGDGIPDAVDSDDDNDGMPDSYEQQYFPWLDQWVNDANEDADMDGFVNIREYNAKTNPLDRDDHPSRILSPAIIYLLIQ